MHLDYVKEKEPWYALYGTMLAELDVQRTMKSAELRTVTMALASLIGPSIIHNDNMVHY